MKYVFILMTWVSLWADALDLHKEAQELIVQGEFKAAVAKYDQAMALEPKNLDWMLAKGRLHYWMGENVDALRVLEGCPAEKEWVEREWRMCATLLLRERKDDRGKELIDRARERGEPVAGVLRASLFAKPSVQWRTKYLSEKESDRETERDELRMETLYSEIFYQGGEVGLMGYSAKLFVAVNEETYLPTNEILISTLPLGGGVFLETGWNDFLFLGSFGGHYASAFREGRLKAQETFVPEMGLGAKYLYKSLSLHVGWLSLGRLNKLYREFAYTYHTSQLFFFNYSDTYSDFKTFLNSSFEWIEGGNVFSTIEYGNQVNFRVGSLFMGVPFEVRYRSFKEEQPEFFTYPHEWREKLGFLIGFPFGFMEWDQEFYGLLEQRKELQEGNEISGQGRYEWNYSKGLGYRMALSCVLLGGHELKISAGAFQNFNSYEQWETELSYQKWF